ncbi:hypothetical protein ACQ4PT_033053 [Festuca glaucescens]
MAAAMEVDAGEEKPSEKELFLAAESGDADAFSSLAPADLAAALSLRNEDGRSLLHVVTALLAAGDQAAASAVNGKDEEGWAPIHSVASSGNAKIIEILLDQASCAADKGYLDRGWLQWNCSFRYISGSIYLNFGPLKFFLTKFITPGADVDLATDAGRTALHYTASKGRRAIAETLIARRANVNKKDKFGCTPLHRAASTGNADMCECLIEEGADIDAVDKTGQSPLMHAVICEDRGVALLLIRHGADVDIEDKEGYTALGRASDSFRPTLIDAAKAMLEG